MKNNHFQDFPEKFPASTPKTPVDTCNHHEEILIVITILLHGNIAPTLLLRLLLLSPLSLFPSDARDGALRILHIRIQPHRRRRLQHRRRGRCARRPGRRGEGRGRRRIEDALLELRRRDLARRGRGLVECAVELRDCVRLRLGVLDLLSPFVKSRSTSCSEGGLPCHARRTRIPAAPSWPATPSGRRGRRRVPARASSWSLMRRRRGPGRRW